MKSLFINNKRVVIPDNTYFPFTQRIGDIDEFNIIGLPVTKTVEIPVCPVNDEIFGHIAEITRMIVDNPDTLDADNLVGIAFNQIKRTGYKLYSDSELISEGIIRIVNITDTTYEVELYDKLIDLLEQFDGDDETGEGYLSNLDLLTQTEVFEPYCTANEIYAIATNPNSEVKVLSNINGLESKDKALISIIPVSGTTQLGYKTLDEAITATQFRTLKPYEFDYAVPIKTVIHSINQYYNVLEVDPLLEDLFSQVHLNLGKPKNKQVRSESIVSGTTLVTSYGSVPFFTNPASDFPFKATTGAWRGNENGNHYMNIPINLTFTPQTTTNLLAYNVATDTNWFSNAPYGTWLGDLRVDISVQGKSGSTVLFESQPINTLIKLYVGVNTTVNTTPQGSITSIEINATVPVNLDWFPNLNGDIYNTYIKFNFSNMFNQPTSALILTRKQVVFIYASFSLDKTISNFNLTYTSDRQTRSGDIIEGKSLFPKVSIKEFIVQLCKYFNLGIRNNNGRINIHLKQYKLDNKPLLLDKITSMNVNNFDFSKLKLTSEVTTNEHFSDYEKYTNKVYGEKVINTGYKIRKNTKEIKFGVGIPGLMRDTNSFAYDRFTNYKNGGYSRVLNGVSEGLDGLQFCYILKQDEPLWVSNDNYYEANMIAGGLIPTEQSFGLYNEKLTYNENNGLYNYPTVDGSGSRMLPYQYTASPYLFDEDWNILKSLEFGKPEYSFANVTDALYPESVTAYNLYQKKRVEELYNKNTHILNTRMYIERSIDIYKVYNYKNTYYIIYNIVEYDPTVPGIYEIELLRVNNIANYVVPVYLLDYEIVQEFELEGNQTSYSANLLGFENIVYQSTASPDNFIQSKTINYNKDSVTYNAGTNRTKVTQVDTFKSIMDEDLTYKYKIGNNIFRYKMTNGSIAGYPLSESSVITIPNTSGTTICKNTALNTDLLIENNGQKIVDLEVTQALKSSFSTSYNGISYTWELIFSYDVKITYGSELFESGSRHRFGVFAVEWWLNPIDKYINKYGFDEVQEISYQLIGTDTIRCTFMVEFSGMASNMTAWNNNIGKVWIKSFNDTGNEYPQLEVSIAGDYTDTIYTIDDTTEVEFQLSGGTYPTHFYNFIGDNDNNLYLTAKNYKITYNYNKTRQ